MVRRRISHENWQRQESASSNILLAGSLVGLSPVPTREGYGGVHQISGIRAAGTFLVREETAPGGAGSSSISPTSSSGNRGNAGSS